MKKVYCCKCQALVGKLAPGSKFQSGLTYVCKDCSEPPNKEPFDFGALLRGFGDKNKRYN